MTGYRRRGTHFSAPERTPARLGTLERHVRASWSLPLFASFAAMAFVFVTVMSPNTPAPSAYAYAPASPTAPREVQTLVASGEYVNAVSRDAYAITVYVPPQAVAPAAGTPDPGTAQAIAYDMVLARGWDQAQFDCLVALWNRESHWNVYAHNTSSGAYGIPQALPGTKMASAGADWATNPATQITWGLGYIQGRYTNPCGAWNASERQGWY